MTVIRTKLSRAIQILGLGNISLAVMMGGILFQSPAFAQDVSKEAQRYLIRGRVAMEDAKDLSGYRDAVREFKKATDLAPKWGAAWFNLGVAHEKAGDLTGAVSSYKKYVALSPNASDKATIETRIIRLEYRNEKAIEKKRKSENVAADRARKNRLVQPFRGAWYVYTCLSKKGYGCKDKELRGGQKKNWDPAYSNPVLRIKANIYFNFPGDGTVVDNYKTSCGKIVGVPQGGNISDTKWYGRLDIHSNGITWTIRKDGKWRQLWAVTKQGSILVSCNRPVDETNHNPKKPYYYTLFQKP